MSRSLSQPHTKPPEPFQDTRIRTTQAPPRHMACEGADASATQLANKVFAHMAEVGEIGARRR